MRTDEAEERGTNPLVCCQRCGLYQFVYRSAQGLFISITRPSTSTGDQRIHSSSFCLGCKNSIPLQSRNTVTRYSMHIHKLFIFSPTFQLVELDLGWCKPAHPLQRCVYYETITRERQPRSLLKMHKSPNLRTVTARK